MTISNSETKENPETVGKYVVLDNLKFNIFSRDWTAKEELLMLQGITKCGMGNWIDISE
jgi:transcriptional adapter 2-alpha